MQTPRTSIAGLKAAAAFAALMMSGTASAIVTCEGKITYLALNPDGSVNVAVNGYGTWGMCNLSTPYSLGSVTFTPESCRAWYATFLAAQKAGSTIRLYFNTSANSANGAECTAIGHWVYPNPAPYHMVSVD
jgi:hypothetical protein